MSFIIVKTTCPDKKEAKKIAKALIDEKLAACIHINEIESFYKWQEEFCNDEEILLNIKTKKEHFKKIQKKIKELHSYDVPEIISVKIDEMTKEYKKFIKESFK